MRTTAALRVILNANLMNIKRYFHKESCMSNSTLNINFNGGIKMASDVSFKINKIQLTKNQMVNNYTVLWKTISWLLSRIK